MNYCSKCGCALAEDMLSCPACSAKSDLPVQAAEPDAVPLPKGYTLIDKLPGLILLPLLFSSYLQPVLLRQCFLYLKTSKIFSAKHVFFPCSLRVCF